MERVTEGISKAADWLLGQQHEQGYWCGELEADCDAGGRLHLHAYAAGDGRSGKMERAVNEILRHQNEDGGWSLYPGGPSNVNYGVKATWR